MRLLTMPLLVCLATSGCTCLERGSGGTGGGQGGSSGKDFDYDLVEATGEWSVTGSSVEGTCTSTTTLAKVTLSLPQPDSNAASFVPRLGLLTAFASVSNTIAPRQGTKTCTGSCPSSADQSLTLPGFATVMAAPALMGDAPDGMAFVPELKGITLPRLCSGVSFLTSGAELRGRPITVAELKSGRFVIEGSGTGPIVLDDTFDTNATSVEGQLTWNFKLVFQTADYNPANAITPPTFANHDRCALDLAPTADELEAAAAAYAQGMDEIPLTADGCQKLTRQRNGTAETVKYVLTRGTRLVYDAATNTSRAEPDTVTPFELTTDESGLHQRFDDNGDGVPDRTIDELKTGGTWQSTVSKVFVPGSSIPKEQVTRTPVDATTMHVKFELDGQLNDEFDTPTRQAACVDSSSPRSAACPGGTPPTCGGSVSPCTGTQKKDILKTLSAALKKGKDCMKKNGFDSVQPKGQGLSMISTGKLNLLCSSNPCDPFGYFEGVPNANGSHDLMVNTVRDATQIPQTLFHEMLHSDPRFDHNDKLDKLASKMCKLQITDRTYACETMCFLPEAGRSCSCARCLNPDRYKPPSKAVCDKCKSDGQDCPGRTGERYDGTMGTLSQGIASYCERGGTLCDTTLECNRACASIGGGCKLLKSMCDDGGCN